MMTLPQGSQDQHFANHRMAWDTILARSATQGSLCKTGVDTQRGAFKWSLFSGRLLQ